jgi:hypothetical protein
MCASQEPAVFPRPDSLAPPLRHQRACRWTGRCGWAEDMAAVDRPRWRRDPRQILGYTCPDLYYGRELANVTCAGNFDARVLLKHCFSPPSKAL